MLVRIIKPVYDTYKITDEVFCVIGIKGNEYLTLDCGTILWWDRTCFEIIDPRPSKYWIVSKLEPNLVCFKEYVEDIYFYTKLFDDYHEDGWEAAWKIERQAWEVLNKYEHLMSHEFDDSSLTWAKVVDGGLLCDECNEAWQPDIYAGKSCCPKCEIPYNNSLWNLKNFYYPDMK
jgi:uncharacterized CHY-type Zn-finger protein